MTAIVASFVALAASSVATFVAQVTTTEPSSLATVVAGTTSTAAIGGLVYVVKLMASGDWVHVNHNDSTRELGRIADQLTRLVDETHHLIRESHEREKDYRALLFQPRDDR